MDVCCFNPFKTEKRPVSFQSIGSTGIIECGNFLQLVDFIVADAAKALLIIG